MPIYKDNTRRFHDDIDEEHFNLSVENCWICKYRKQYGKKAAKGKLYGQSDIGHFEIEGWVMSANDYANSVTKLFSGVYTDLDIEDWNVDSDDIPF